MRKNIEVNKSLQKEVVFLGLKAKFIYYMLYLFVGTIIFALIFSSAIGPILSLLVGLCIFIIGLMILLYYSRTFGENGWIKKKASKSQPDKIRVTTNPKAILWTKQKILKRFSH